MDLERIVDLFPQVEFAMAYGSGVFQQQDYDSSTSMVDLVLAVKNPLEWHQQNLQRNGSHYSSISHFGPTALTQIQEKFGAGIYYNTLVPIPSCPGRLMKYGVISTDKLCDDFANWSTLYLSGRMHKPVNVLQSTAAINRSATENLSHALNVALLLLPSEFTQEELYMKIASISYLGDFRMTFGENPKKVQNIVHGNMENFTNLYRKRIEENPNIDFITYDESRLSTNCDIEVRKKMLEKLPLHLHTCLFADDIRKGQSEYNAKLQEMSLDKKNVLLKRSIASVVFKYSRTQSLKGIATAGALKSLLYVGQKLSKVYLK